jgi:hypothetical protein
LIRTNTFKRAFLSWQESILGVEFSLRVVAAYVVK